MPPTAELRVDDDGAASSQPTPSGRTLRNVPLLELPLPETAAEVRRRAVSHTLYAYKGYKDEYRFKHWCVFVPHPLSTAADADETEAQTSAFLLAQFRSIGDSLPSNVLLVNLVTADGAPNLAAGADIARVLGYEARQTPILIFTNVPRLTIYPSYDSVELLALKTDVVDGVAISLGGVSKSAIKDVVRVIPKIFSGETPMYDELRQRVQWARNRTTRHRRLKKTIAIGGPIVTILGAIGKAVLKTGGA
ncbi:MAG: hypothetical protein AB7O32_17145 [Vicinamibacterales bacterium]